MASVSLQSNFYLTRAEEERRKSEVRMAEEASSNEMLIQP